MKKLPVISLILLLLSACQDGVIDSSSQDVTDQKLSVTIPEALLNYQPGTGARVAFDLKEQLNATLFANSNIQVSEIDIFEVASEGLVVETLDQQFESTLDQRWVPGDVNRNWNGDNDLDDIDWMSFTPFSIANGVYDAEPIYRAMYDKWETETYCNTVSIDETVYDFSMGNPSLILDFGLPSTGLPLVDISLIGFIPGEIFEAVLGAENILGVAFSFIFIDELGEPISTTRGKDDKAYAEVWLNDGFTWGMGASPGVIDLESVILHEFGHTLNLGHFGILQSFTDNDGNRDLVYRPVNTMNAIYIGEDRNFLGPNDKGNFCESWGSWPWN